MMDAARKTEEQQSLCLTNEKKKRCNKSREGKKKYCLLCVQQTKSNRYILSMCFVSEYSLKKYGNLTCM